MTKIKFIFFGTPEFAKIILEKLIRADFIPTAVVTNPDRPVGRKKVLTPPPVKSLVVKCQMSNVKCSIEILQPENLSAIGHTLSAMGPDFGILAAYGKIIPKEIIDIFPKGIIVVHPSLLPKYRGATPIQNAILADEKKTGTTLIVMDEKVDHGKIISNSEFLISKDDNYETLSKKLAGLSGDLLIETLPKYLSGGIKPQPQDHSRATYTKKFTGEDGFVDEASLRLATETPSLRKTVSLAETKNLAKKIWLKIRALNPEPGTWTLRRGSGQENGRRMKILAADLNDRKLVLRKIQFEGERPQALNTKQHE